MKRAAGNSDKRQTEILIGIALLVLAALFACYALIQPRIGSAKINDITTTAAAPSFNAQAETVSLETKPQQDTKAIPINLNTCTAEDLLMIDGIGESRANAILAYRDYLGGYTSVDQIKNISGIGDATYAELAPYLTV